METPGVVLRSKKEELETKVIKLIKAFENETGVTVKVLSPVRCTSAKNLFSNKPAVPIFINIKLEI